jgi:hypothetical protein
MQGLTPRSPSPFRLTRNRDAAMHTLPQCTSHRTGAKPERRRTNRDVRSLSRALGLLGLNFCHVRRHRPRAVDCPVRFASAMACSKRDNAATISSKAEWRAPPCSIKNRSANIRAPGHDASIDGSIFILRNAPTVARISHVPQIGLELLGKEAVALKFAHASGMVIVIVIVRGPGSKGHSHARLASVSGRGIVPGLAVVVFGGFAAAGLRQCMRWPMLDCVREAGSGVSLRYAGKLPRRHCCWRCCCRAAP